MSIATTIEIEPDDTTDVVLQCRVRGSGVASSFASTDTLSAELWQPGGAAPMATSLPIGWLQIAPATGMSQTGYDQGQVVVTLLLSLVSTLQPTVSYTLKIFRVMASDTSRRERIATIKIRIRALAVK